MSLDPSPLSCTLSAIDHFSQYGYSSACSYVKDACADQTNTIDFFSFYYCTLNQKMALFIPLAILVIFLIFYLVYSTAEDYLEPAVSKISRKLKLSESLAGVTLVALANGAPDVITAFAAGGNIDQGVLVPMGGLLGAGIFTFTIILAVCILFSKNKTILSERRALVRDCGFYIFGILYMLGLGLLVGEINIFGTLGFFLQYVVFLVLVLYQEAQYRKEAAVKRRQTQTLSFTIALEPSLAESLDGDLLMDGLLRTDYIKHPKYQFTETGSIILPNEGGPENETTTIGSQRSIISPPTLQWRYAIMRHKIWLEFEDMADKNLVGKAFFLIMYPLKMARDLTIPASSSEQWAKWKAVLQPFFIPVFLLWQFGFFSVLFNSVYLTIIICLSAISSLIIWKITQTKDVPNNAFGFFLTVLAFVISVTWINLIANVLVDFIALLSVFTNLPLNFLGLTLVAFGGSTPDFFVDLTLAKKGLGQTAASGIFAGQYFNVGIGFGAALTRQVLAYGPRPFSLIPQSHIDIINIVLVGCLILSLVVVLIYGQRNKYVFKKDFAVYSIVLYIAFLASVTVLSF